MSPACSHSISMILCRTLLLTVIFLLMSFAIAVPTNAINDEMCGELPAAFCPDCKVLLAEMSEQASNKTRLCKNKTRNTLQIVQHLNCSVALRCGSSPLDFSTVATVIREARELYKRCAAWLGSEDIDISGAARLPPRLPPPGKGRVCIIKPGL
jgi:hypothetical protein